MLAVTQRRKKKKTVSCLEPTQRSRKLQPILEKNDAFLTDGHPWPSYSHRFFPSAFVWGKKDGQMTLLFIFFFRRVWCIIRVFLPTCWGHLGRRDVALSLHKDHLPRSPLVQNKRTTKITLSALWSCAMTRPLPRWWHKCVLCRCERRVCLVDQPFPGPPTFSSYYRSSFLPIVLSTEQQMVGWRGRLERLVAK